MSQPHTLEDQLLWAHFEKHSGTTYLEFPVAIENKPAAARRIDAVLIPGTERQILSRADYNFADAAQAMRGEVVHVIEAKQVLNRSVIGQLLVAEYLIEELVQPSEIVLTAVCVDGTKDLKSFCKTQGIEVCFYPVSSTPGSRRRKGWAASGERVDQRKPPDEARKRIFLKGWADAVSGTLYGSIRKRKTHANMGNLFGWIYGDVSTDFRLATWQRYIDNSPSIDKE